MNRKKEDIVIEALQYAKKHESGGFTKAELNTHLIAQDYSKNDVDSFIVRGFIRYFDDYRYQKDDEKDDNWYEYEPPLYMLEKEARFHLLEYVELQEARQSSRDAKKIAFWAIGISLISTIAAIVFSIYQITHPTEVVVTEDVQVQQLGTNLQEIETQIEGLTTSSQEINEQVKQIKILLEKSPQTQAQKDGEKLP